MTLPRKNRRRFDLDGRKFFYQVSQSKKKLASQRSLPRTLLTYALRYRKIAHIIARILAARGLEVEAIEVFARYLAKQLGIDSPLEDRAIKAPSWNAETGHT